MIGGKHIIFGSVSTTCIDVVDADNEGRDGVGVRFQDLGSSSAVAMTRVRSRRACSGKFWLATSDPESIRRVGIGCQVSIA